MDFSMHEFRGHYFQPLLQGLKAANLKKKKGGGKDVGNFAFELGNAGLDPEVIQINPYPTNVENRVSS